jgi:RNA polymerase sigma-70 factor (sigma-E family)
VGANSERVITTPARSGDDRDAAFTAFVRARGTALARSAFLIVGDLSRSEDVLQTALAETYLRWHRLRRAEAAEAYVRQAIITANAAWWRRRSNSELPQVTLPDRVIADAAPSIIERHTLMEALRQLSPRQRAVIVLRYFDDLTERETARMLGCSAGSVKKHASRALDRLRVLLGAEWESAYAAVTPLLVPAEATTC